MKMKWFKKQEAKKNALHIKILKYTRKFYFWWWLSVRYFCNSLQVNLLVAIHVPLSLLPSFSA